jgi:RNA polymerase II-associated factor 1
MSYRRVVDDAPVDVSHAAQIADIEATFSDDFSPIDLSTLKHPTKRGVHAVDTYDILPDSEIWANAYDVFKFSERPGERALDVSFRTSSV